VTYTDSQMGSIFNRDKSEMSGGMSSFPKNISHVTKQTSVNADLRESEGNEDDSKGVFVHSSKGVIYYDSSNKYSNSTS
jgi:hypothetical protein